MSSAHQRYSDEEYLEDLRRVARELDRVPTGAEYTDHGDHDRSSLTRRFGGWNAALAAAGLPSNPNGGVRARELLYAVVKTEGSA